MNKKIMTLFLIIAVLLCSIAIVSAENNTTNVTNDTEDTIDLSNYITALSSGKEIQFSDGYTGYLIDTSKNELTDNDGFTSYPTTNIDGNIGNYLKLAVIECYKQNKESEISDVISMILDGSYKNRENPIINAVLRSDQTINDHESVEIDNSTEGTFDFELLKPRNQATSDYFAYKVSLKTIENDDVLGVADGNDTNQTKEIENQTNATAEADQNKTENNNTTVKNEELANDTNASKANATDNETKENSTEKINETKTIETNKTIVNKTNTLTINENNTTVVNKTTVTHINNTTNDTPQNNTITDNLMKTVGNPISILIIVIVVIAIVSIAMRRKG
jgi:hypothetical protein